MTVQYHIKRYLCALWPMDVHGVPPQQLVEGNRR